MKHKYKTDKTRRIDVERHRFKRTGWSREAFATAMEQQQGLCAIEGCTRKAIDADHCHITGKPRALLCRSHNWQVGIYEKKDFHAAIVAYVEKWKVINGPTLDVARSNTLLSGRGGDSPPGAGNANLPASPCGDGEPVTSRSLGGTLRKSRSSVAGLATVEL